MRKALSAGRSISFCGSCRAEHIRARTGGDVFPVGKVKSKQIGKRKSLRNAHSENERKTGVFCAERAKLFQEKHSYGYFYKLLENSRKGALCRAPYGIKISRKTFDTAMNGSAAASARKHIATFSSPTAFRRVFPKKQKEELPLLRRSTAHKAHTF